MGVFDPFGVVIRVPFSSVGYHPRLFTFIPRWGWERGGDLIQGRRSHGADAIPGQDRSQCCLRPISPKIETKHYFAALVSNSTKAASFSGPTIKSRERK